jgi:hypothetical protein
MEPVIAVYDACVLYSAFLRDLLMRVAIHGRLRNVLRAKWTGRIHREWMRAIRRRKPEVPLADLRRTRRLMDRHVRGCRVRHYERWERRLTFPIPMTVTSSPPPSHVWQTSLSPSTPQIFHRRS